MEDLMAWHGCSEARQVWDILLDFGDEVLVDRFAKVESKQRPLLVARRVYMCGM